MEKVADAINRLAEAQESFNEILKNHHAVYERDSLAGIAHRQGVEETNERRYRENVAREEAQNTEGVEHKKELWMERILQGQEDIIQIQKEEAEVNLEIAKARLEKLRNS